MKYSEAVEYLHQVQGRGVKLGTRNIVALLDTMGKPQEAYPTIAVAGTNGKGSVCAMLEAILRRAGYRTGLYTSPHLIRYEERIAVGGTPVDSSEFAAAIGRVRDAIEASIREGRLETHPTHFEILTAAALDTFRRERVTAAVLEVGMGGRLDAVSVAGAGVAVITTIGLEHTRFLGDTLEKIAFEKAGVIRAGSRVISGVATPSAAAVIRRTASERGARLIERASVETIPDPAGRRGRFSLVTKRARYEDLVIPLAGRHQIDNAALAVLAAEAFDEDHAPATGLDPPTVREGLAASRWPGRLQIAGTDPLIVLDAAHNPDGFATLCDSLREIRQEGAFEKAHVLFGVLEDKDLRSMADHLAGLECLPARTTVTRGRSERFRDPLSVASVLREAGIDAVISPDIGAAIEEARSAAEAGEAIVVCGSIYLVGEAMEILDLEPYG